MTSRRVSPVQRGIAGVAAMALLATQVALPPRAEAAHLGSATASAGSAPPPSVSAVQSFQPDLFTGRATTAIPIAVPPGRKGMQPSLGLAYSSSGRNGWLGVGWALDVGYIERSTKNGVPAYGGADPFTFMFQGVSSDLVKIPDGTYRAKDEGLFLRFEDQGASGWEVRDKSGTRYRFGQTPASRIEDTGRVFRWTLDKVLDPNGNTLTIAYTKDQGQLYPLQINYTGHDPTSLGPANRVTFALEDRPDKEVSYRSGFAVTTAQRLKTIATYAPDPQSNPLKPARTYVLSYTTSARTGRSLLSGIRQLGTDGAASLPPATFTYTQDSPTYLHCHNCVPGITPGNNGWQLQYHVGNLFPRDDGGNDQRLWPSGYCEPGQKCWQEQRCEDVKTCRRCWLFGTCCDHQTVCQTVTNCAAIPQVNWSSPQLERAGSSGGITWSTDAGGNLSVSGPQDSHVLAMTWLYTTIPKNVSLAGLSVSGRAEVFYVAPGGSTWSAAPGNQVPLSPGWTVVAVTAYNETGGFSLSMSANLSGQVTAMNHAQFSPMGLAGDFNGDGYTDLAHLEPQANHWHVVPNSPSGFGQEQTWLKTPLPAETVPMAGDVNADGRTDLVLWNSSSGLWQVAAVAPAGTTFADPATWHPGFGAGQTPFMGDFNGDQLLDTGTFSGGAWTIALSTGSGFGSATTWLTGFGAGAAPLTGDFNGDGLTDVAAVSKATGRIDVALGTGSGFAPPTGWMGEYDPSLAPTSADLNGDGLTDAVYYNKSMGTVISVPSLGNTFGAPTTLMEDHPFGLRGENDTLQVGDFRGNGISGFGVFNAVSGAAEIAFALGAPPDLLITIANGLGGATTLTYTPSTEFDNTGGDGVADLAFAMPVVTKVEVSDGLGRAITTAYRYAGGKYAGAPAREFRGFRTVSVADALGTTATTTFSQDEDTKGRPLSAEVRDREGRLFTKTVNTYGCDHDFPGVHFVTLDQTDSFLFDGDDSFRQTRAHFSYDNFGNLREAVEEGDMAVASDERRRATTFVYNTDAWIVNKPARAWVSDPAGATTYSEQVFFYDGNTAYLGLDADGGRIPEIPLSAGNLTREVETLEDGADPITMLTYDPYGNVKTVTDALTRTTTNTYDAATHTYLEVIANVLGHTRQLRYDPRFGHVTSSTDQNGVTAETAYDELGRVTKVVGPNDKSELPAIRYEYDPCLAAASCNPPIRSIVRTRVQSGKPEELTAYAFSDGLGRTIQTRSPAEDSAKQVVAGAVELDARGLVAKQWVPYLDAFSASYVPHTLVAGLAPPVQYAYDAVGRLITTTDPDGSVTAIRYQDGTTIATDALGRQTWRTADAYGRLVSVDEVLSETEMATTTYEYDLLDNLTKVIDARGNVTTMQYDTLSRKVAMSDPDMGAWTYAYDAVDNLKSQTDARGVTIGFQYDALNRLREKYYLVPADSGIAKPRDVTYAYDNPDQLFSKGKLTEIADGSGSSSFEYDNLGRLVKETKTIDGAAYTIQRAYDLLGRLTSLTYPDGETASYAYNAQGGIDTVDLQSPVFGLQSVVSNVDYNAAGQLTKIAYGNGVVTDYAYDPQTLRLSSLRTTNSELRTLQDFSYAFDPLGNVSAITDRVHSGTQSFQYDALNRLTQAIGSYGTFAYAYDPIGNMLEKEGVAMGYGLPDGSKPHAVTSTSADWTMAYDANGNLIKKATDNRLPTTDLTAQYLSYDAESRLVDVKTAPEESVTVAFQPGWNFFSLPVIPADTSVIALLPSFAQDFEQIARFEPATGTFTHYVGNPAFDDFAILAYGVGYEVYCKNPNGVTLTLKGKLPTKGLSHALAGNWHLLPAVTLESKPPAWLTGGLDADQLLAYDGQILKPATEVAAAQAYFAHLRTASTFAPSLPRDPTTRFVYDTDGGQIKKITPAGTTLYLSQAYEISPTKTTKYVFIGQRRVASKDSAGNVSFYHADHLGSTNVVTNANGQPVQLLEYTPYGLLSRKDGSLEIEHQFTGKRQDPSTGLAFYETRHYDSQLGRFISPDTLVPNPGNPQDLNRYTYANNNPVTNLDPTGHGWLKWFFLALTIALTIIFPPTSFLTAMTATLAMTSAVAGVLPGRTAQIVSQITGLAAAAITAVQVGVQVATGVKDWAMNKWELIGPEGTITNPQDIATKHGGKVHRLGIRTDAKTALEVAKENNSAVYFKPTSGGIADFTESFLQKVTFTSAGDRAFAGILKEVPGAVHLIGHSQGALGTANTLLQLGFTGHRLAEGSTVTFAAYPITQVRGVLSAAVGGAKPFFKANVGDVINLAGPNLDPFKIVGGVVGISTSGAKPHALSEYGILPSSSH